MSRREISQLWYNFPLDILMFYHILITNITRIVCGPVRRITLLILLYLSDVLSDDALDIPSQCGPEARQGWSVQARIMLQSLYKTTV